MGSLRPQQCLQLAELDGLNRVRVLTVRGVKGRSGHYVLYEFRVFPVLGAPFDVVHWEEGETASMRVGEDFMCKAHVYTTRSDRTLRVVRFGPLAKGGK